VRLFAGIELDDAVRSGCAAAARDLAGALRAARVNLDIRWIPEENLHITLWFFGEVPDGKAEQLVETLRAPWPVPPFALAISGAGAFPPSGVPRIVWLGLSQGARSLAAVYDELSVRLPRLGFEPERRAYHPHVTIGRVREPARRAARARGVLEAAAVRSGEQHVTAVTLFRSRLSPAGAKYEPLVRVPLQGC
jgi:2'-5' RNA ligase